MSLQATLPYSAVGIRKLPPGIEVDIHDPKRFYRQLFADWRCIGNVGYPRLKHNKGWGDWSIEDMVRYIARIVDALRSVYFPIIPPSKRDPGYKTPYWEIYRIAEPLMKSRPPRPAQLREWDRRRKSILGHDTFHYETTM